MMRMRCNQLAWNPMEPMNFVLACEDHNAYSFDMRKLDNARCVHKGHVSAVMDVAFSPTGREFVTGSYDRTVRVFAENGAKSREVYHTKRMQRVFSVRFSADSRFILSGSDDTNVRIWKADANQRLGRVAPREMRKRNYQKKLTKRFVHTKEVRRLVKHKHVPKAIKKAADLKRTQEDAERVKDDRRRRHAKKGDPKHKRKAERKKNILGQLE